MIKIIPTKKQFLKWSIPNKVTYLGFWIGIISLFIALLDTFVGLSNLSHLIKIKEASSLSSELCKSLKESPSLENISQYQALFPEAPCDIDKNLIRVTNGDEYFAVSAKLLTKYREVTQKILASRVLSKISKYYILTILDNVNTKDSKIIDDNIKRNDQNTILNEKLKLMESEINDTYGSCKNIKNIMPSFEIFSEIPYEYVYDVKIETLIDKRMNKYKINDFFKKHKVLKNLILTSVSMSDFDRRYWYNVSSIMPEKNIKEVSCILLLERRMSDDINAKHQGVKLHDIDGTNLSQLQLIKEMVDDGSVDKAILKLKETSLIEIKNNFNTVIYILEQSNKKHLIESFYNKVINTFSHEEYLFTQETYGDYLLDKKNSDGYRLLKDCISFSLSSENYKYFSRCIIANSRHLDSNLAIKSIDYMSSVVPISFWEDNNDLRANYLGNLGWYLILNKDNNRAIKILKQSLNYKEQSWVYLNLSSAYYITGNKDKAEKVYMYYAGDLAFREDVISDFNIFINENILSDKDLRYITDFFSREKTELQKKSKKAVKMRETLVDTMEKLKKSGVNLEDIKPGDIRTEDISEETKAMLRQYMK